ncbi:DUF3899 domain-containing protein [Vallitalea okinawensis]|uniref:DUF3899 domain-containing protein n=1 Tax=Vallitalea okinawensis TaxID=2078660 RepID=UPI0013003466|nr:DUF3899 domain-containing protein [Vallitalea okinawensis]
MNRKLKLFLVITAVTTTLSVLIGLLSDTFLLAFVNYLFIFGGIIAVIGGFMAISETGLFRITSYPYKKVKWFFGRPSTGYDEDELKDDDGKKMKFNEYIAQDLPKYFSTKPILFSGLLLVIVSFVVSVTVII